MKLMQEVIAKTRYARYLEDKQRREHWPETVARYMNQLKKTAAANGWEVPKNVADEIHTAILNCDVMPSMRLMMTAGEAVDRDNICAYNCAYLAVNSKRSFAEALYILMNGTGVGFSCERQEIQKLPSVPEKFERVDDVIVVQDSKLGWAKAFLKLLNMLWEGDIPNVDYSRIRPAGARLRTFGGRASGPDPLKSLFDFVAKTFQEAAGRKLSSLEVHDIMCKIGEIVVVGGVRRSALISLSNLSDRRLREAKSGNWWEAFPHRALSNNSVAYTEKPDSETFLEEWLSLVKSKSGERGIFNRKAAQAQAAKYGRRPADKDYGCNPCSEIILRDKQFCNLSEVVVREDDTFETLSNKIRLATIIGTVQSCLTNFEFLSGDWKRNCEEERLLGVSLTGVFDNLKLLDASEKELDSLRQIAYNTNLEVSELLSINPSAAITCIKPSGTVSQLVDCASGLHPRHSAYYIRNVRMDNKDPVTQFLISQGVKAEPDAMYPMSVTVFSFPVKAPAHCITRNMLSASSHLKLWLKFQRGWCEHKPSVTINVRDNEWPTLGAEVFTNFDSMSGVAFLPMYDHVYKQAPYQECTREEYDALAAVTPTTINWELLIENEDQTEGTQTLACVGNTCEIV